jgi:hypothetical protein
VHIHCIRSNRTKMRKSTKARRYTLYGHCKESDMQLVCPYMQRYFKCMIYGGFARDGCWEAVMMSFRRSIPSITEISMAFEKLPVTVSCVVEPCSNVIDSTLLTFICRINGFTQTFGTYPRHISSRIKEHQARIEEESMNDNVERATGYAVNAHSVLNLSDHVDDLIHELQFCRGLVDGLLQHHHSV